MDEKTEKRGRPLGSGNKKDVILGIRVSKEEYNIIKEGLAKLKGKYKTNKNIILYLFKKYNILEENNKKSDKMFLKIIIEEMKKKEYTKEEKEQLIKEIYKTIENKDEE